MASKCIILSDKKKMKSEHETLFRREKYALLALQREDKLYKQVPCVLTH